MVFPEGTRFDPTDRQLVSKSRNHAVNQGLKPLKNLLTPRTKAAWLCVEQLRGTAAAIYDVTVAYSGTVDSMTGQRKAVRGLPGKSFKQGSNIVLFF